MNIFTSLVTNLANLTGDIHVFLLRQSSHPAVLPRESEKPAGQVLMDAGAEPPRSDQGAMSHTSCSSKERRTGRIRVRCESKLDCLILCDS